MTDHFYQDGDLDQLMEQLLTTSGAIAQDPTSKRLAHLMNLRTLIDAIKLKEGQETGRRVTGKYIGALAMGVASAPEILVPEPAKESTIRDVLADLFLSRRLRAAQETKDISQPQDVEAENIALGLATIAKVDARLNRATPTLGTMLGMFERNIASRSETLQKMWAETCKRIDERVQPPTI